MNKNSRDIAEKVLGLARARADAAEVIYQESEGSSVGFQDNRLKSVNTREVSGVGLRVIHKGRLGFSCTNDLRDLDILVTQALHSAEFGQEARFRFPADSQGPEVKLYDPKAVELSMEHAAQMTREGIDCILSEIPDAHCSGGVSRGMGRSVLCNTSGLHTEEVSTEVDMGISGFVVVGESFLWTDEGESSCRFSPDFLRHARKVVEWIKLCKREVRLGAERLPVLFTPKALGFLLSTFESNVNGKLVQKGASVLADRIGQQVLGKCVTLWDDPLVDYATGSYSMDAEGVTAQKRALFENGVLRTFLYDLQTAGMMGTQSTGNASRGYSSMPAPGPANVRLAPGETPCAKMLAGIKRGLLVDQTLGAGQSNMLAGDFSVNLELGFLVENGEIVGRVKDCMLAGNAFDAFNNIRDISAETEWHGSAELPSVCFEALSVVGRES